MKNILNKLPMEVIEEMKDVLKAYDECNVVFENGKYYVRTSYCLQKTYSDDYKVIGTFEADDVYTQEEQELNYIEEFRCYPPVMTLKIKVDGMTKWKLISQYENDEISFKELKEALGL